MGRERAGANPSPVRDPVCRAVSFSECFVSCVTAEVAFPSTSCTLGLWGLSLCLGGYYLYQQGAFPGVGCVQLRKG